MHKLLAGAATCALVLFSGGIASAQGDHYVSGYTRSNGTYVAPHYQTNPNSTTSDNYSTRGNVNPYTGEPGTKPDTNPGYGAYQAPTYSTPSYSTPSYQAPSNPYAPKPACTSIYGC